MDKRDVEIIAQGLAPVVREFVKQAVEPLQKRIAELERRERQGAERMHDDDRWSG